MSSGDLNKKSKSKIPTPSRVPMYLKMTKKTEVTTLMPKTKNRIVVIMVLATASSKVRMPLMMTMATNMITRMMKGATKMIMQMTRMMTTATTTLQAATTLLQVATILLQAAVATKTTPMLTAPDP
ncbi:hypothetical protein QL285_065268 [Trifolium repens]|jgi:cobalamin synthase|nr:hypothetical protein QL285_065268 [Trifolium repens]